MSVDNKQLHTLKMKLASKPTLTLNTNKLLLNKVRRDPLKLLYCGTSMQHKRRDSWSERDTPLPATTEGPRRTTTSGASGPEEASV